MSGAIKLTIDSIFAVQKVTGYRLTTQNAGKIPANLGLNSLKPVLVHGFLIEYTGGSKFVPVPEADLTAAEHYIASLMK